VDGKIHPEGVVQHRHNAYAALRPNAYAALRPRDGFSHPHQEHMKDTYGKIHPEGVVQHRHNAYAALRPRDGFSHPHQEHMKDTYNATCMFPLPINLFRA